MTLAFVWQVKTYKMRSALGGMWPVKPLHVIVSIESQVSIRLLRSKGISLAILTGHRIRSRLCELVESSCWWITACTYLEMSRVAFSPSFNWVTPSSQPELSRVVLEKGKHGLRRGMDCYSPRMTWPTPILTTKSPRPTEESNLQKRSESRSV